MFELKKNNYIDLIVFIDGFSTTADFSKSFDDKSILVGLVIPTFVKSCLYSDDTSLSERT